MAAEIWFPNLGITIEHLDRVIFRIGGFPVYWYGVIITLAFMAGTLYAVSEAKRIGLDHELVYDFLFVALIGSIIGARSYYVIFSWDSYKNDVIKIFALREGGLAIYGGIIGALITLVIFSRVKKIDCLSFMDIVAPGLVIGQAIGRWGNFFNREAFGGYTENIFAMRYLKDTVPEIPGRLLDKIVTINGAQYIQVHPTFLYECLWNLAVLIILISYRDKKKFEGELSAFYFLLYGLGRIWIEGLRYDQLLIGSTGLAVSQLLSGILIAVSICVILFKRRNLARWP